MIGLLVGAPTFADRKRNVSPSVSRCIAETRRVKVRPYIYERAGRVVPFGRPSVAAKEKNALFTVNGGFFAWKNPVPGGTHKCGGRTWHGDFGAGRRFGLSFQDDGSAVAIRDLTTNEFAHVDNFISGATWLTDGKMRGAMSAKPNRGPLAPRTFVGARNGEFLVVMTSDERAVLDHLMFIDSVVGHAQSLL